MRIETLSDRPTEQLNSTKRRRNRAELGDGVAETNYRYAQDDLQIAREQKSLWKKLFSIVSPDEADAQRRVDEAHRAFQDAAAAHDDLVGTVSQQAAGVKGEQDLATELSIPLSDDWLMIRGYNSRRGETDCVLVGPSGVWAIEVKATNLRLFVDGDSWQYERVDRWSNVVERGEAVTRSGKRWDRQVLDVTEHLSWWLNHNGQTVPVRTAVLIMHSRGSVALSRNASVDHVSADPDQLIDAIEALATPLSRPRADKIANLIRRDHAHHNQG